MIHAGLGWGVRFHIPGRVFRTAQQAAIGQQTDSGGSAAWPECRLRNHHRAEIAPAQAPTPSASQSDHSQVRPTQGCVNSSAAAYSISPMADAAAARRECAGAAVAIQNVTTPSTANAARCWALSLIHEVNTGMAEAGVCVAMNAPSMKAAQTHRRGPRLANRLFTAGMRGMARIVFD